MKRIAPVRRTLAFLAAPLFVASGPLPAQDPAGGGGLAPGGIPGVPDCAARCDAALAEIVRGCTLPDGQIDEQCVEDGKQNFDYVQCLLDCDQSGHVDPAVLACQGSCFDTYANALEGCVDSNNNLDPSCVVASDKAFVECFLACGDVPWFPDLRTCAPPCVQTYTADVETCRAGGPEIDLACFRDKRGVFNGCLGACGLPLLPLEDLCLRRCETDFQAALEACGLIGGGGIVLPEDAECAANAKSAFEACLGGCGTFIPDEIRCAADCDGRLKVRLAECQGNPDCERTALHDYSACLEGCGIVIPPIPEPDPCLTGCDSAYRQSVEGCYDPATGQVSDDCLRQADGAYLGCLEGCGIILPDPPPPDQNDCASTCEMAYRPALEMCFTVKEGGVVEVDPECAAAADANYLRCLEGCGGQPGPLPGDPGLPVGACDQGCGVEILGVLFDCAAANDGVVDMDCLARAGNAFNECLAGCQDQAGDRVRGALARNANQTFLRGDADLNSTVQITDAIQVLSFLFLGGPAPMCQDAADGNDDGILNIADAVAILHSLFLGAQPLPNPSEAAGLDPTPDGLGCGG